MLGIDFIPRVVDKPGTAGPLRRHFNDQCTGTTADVRFYFRPSSNLVSLAEFLPEQPMLDCPADEHEGYKDKDEERHHDCVVNEHDRHDDGEQEHLQPDRLLVVPLYVVPRCHESVRIL